MADMQRGFPARSTAARYIQNRNRLRAAVQRYEQGTLLDVMQAAKYSINMEMINVEEGEDQEEQWIFSAIKNRIALRALHF